MQFIESFMKFDFNSETTLRIEEVKPGDLRSGVKVCECVTCLNENLCFIEAKSSLPKPSSKESLNAFIHDIVQKFIDSLLFYYALRNERFGEDGLKEVPEKLASLPVTVPHQLFLIVHGAQKEWLVPLQDAFVMKLSHAMNAWNMEPKHFKVINQETARNMGLIVSYFPVEERERLINEKMSSDEILHRGEAWLQGKSVADKG